MFYITIYIYFFLIFIFYFHIFGINKIKWKKYNEIIKAFDDLHMNDLNILKCNSSLSYIIVSKIIVFLLSRDRFYAVYYSIKYWLNFNTRLKLIIVILDHNTTFKPLLNYYNYLQKNKGIDIYYLTENRWINAVDKEIPVVITNYLNFYPDVEYYILSDIDIILINIPSNMLDFYSTILSNCDVNVVGPSLMTNDISSQFPDYEKVYKWETHYIATNHYDVLYKKNYFSLVKADIDTIFGMRKKSNRFKRHSKKSYRSLSPYIAHHIDWYITNKFDILSYYYYLNNSKNVNHSGSAFNISNSRKQPF